MSSIFVETFCSFTEGYGNGKEKIPMEGEYDFEECADECFQLRRDGNEAINGATVERKKCFCELNQTRTWYSKEKMNCHFTKNEGEDGNKHYSYFALQKKHSEIDSKI